MPLFSFCSSNYAFALSDCLFDRHTVITGKPVLFGSLQLLEGTHLQWWLQVFRIGDELVYLLTINPCFFCKATKEYLLPVSEELAEAWCTPSPSYMNSNCAPL
jgi:hypothetical protein